MLHYLHPRFTSFWHSGLRQNATHISLVRQWVAAAWHPTLANPPTPPAVRTLAPRAHCSPGVVIAGHKLANSKHHCTGGHQPQVRPASTWRAGGALAVAQVARCLWVGGCQQGTSVAASGQVDRTNCTPHTWGGRPAGRERPAPARWRPRSCPRLQRAWRMAVMGSTDDNWEGGRLVRVLQT